MTTSDLLNGRRVVVSGAAHPAGIGRAIAELFARHGARVVCLDVVAPDGVTDLAEGLDYLACDVTREADCRAAIAAAAERMGGLDTLVNNAGIVGATPLADLAEADFVRMIDINLTGAYRLTRAALPFLEGAAGGAAIVNMASMSASRGGGLLGGSHYAASKGGMISFTKALARELGPRGIRVNAVAPGIVATPMTIGRFPPGREEELRAAIPLGRFASPDDVAGSALFLASGLSAYCTGIVLEVNGGYHIH